MVKVCWKYYPKVVPLNKICPEVFLPKFKILSESFSAEVFPPKLFPPKLFVLNVTYYLLNWQQYLFTLSFTVSTLLWTGLCIHAAFAAGMHKAVQSKDDNMHEIINLKFIFYELRR